MVLISPHRGFSLTELLVVMAILALLMTMALDPLSRVTARSASAGLCRDLFALSNQAHITAVSRGRQVQLVLQNVAPTAQLSGAATVGMAPVPATGWGPVEVQFTPGGRAQINGVTPGVLYTGGQPTTPFTGPVQIIYYPDGSMQVAGSSATGATIFVTDQALGHPTRVVIYGRTSFAKVLDQ